MQIGLKQGLEMLKIFKSYSAKTSLLDDFTFYENQEKSLSGKKNKATLRMEFPKAEEDADDFPVSTYPFPKTSKNAIIPMVLPLLYGI